MPTYIEIKTRKKVLLRQDITHSTIAEIEQIKKDCLKSASLRFRLYKTKLGIIKTSEILEEIK